MEEIWKDITGYEGLYQVSNLGRVKSLERVIIFSDGRNHFYKEKILNVRKNRDGYILVDLYKDKVMKTSLLHRLVAKAFLENPNNYPCINHKDENKENNKVNNLEWCTQKYNINYGTAIKRRSKPIYCLETNKIYKSSAECAKELNLNRMSIVHVLKGRQKQAKGYTFRYTNQVLYIGGK